MILTPLDWIIFVAFIALVVGISFSATTKHETSEEYFLAGRGLPWWLIGFSLIAANISTEQFVGMAGSAYGTMGLAVAGYEWLAAIMLVLIGWFVLPVFLKCGLYTMPEFLEYRYGSASRALMASLMLIMYVAVALASVLYSGALALSTIFDVNLIFAVWAIGLLAAVYTVYGGLQAVAWADLIQGIALLIGGAVVMFLGFEQAGGVENFLKVNEAKLHLALPATDHDMPWTSLLMGIWIPIFFYWGLNQFIVQKTLASKSLAAGQQGLVFAAFLKLFIPFIIVFPGIMAYQLYASEINTPDQAYPVLLKHLLPNGLRGAMFAALFGAVMSSLDSLLNSASTIFTIDLYKRHIRPQASSDELVRTGRISTGICALIACSMAPWLANPQFGGVFKYIQMFQGFVSPGIVTAFLFGLLLPRAPQAAALTAMVLNIPVYGALLYFLPEVSFLNHMAATTVVLMVVAGVVTALWPLAEPRLLPVRAEIDLTPSRTAQVGGVLVIIATLGLYCWFW